MLLISLFIVFYICVLFLDKKFEPKPKKLSSVIAGNVKKEKVLPAEICINANVVVTQNKKSYKLWDENITIVTVIGDSAKAVGILDGNTVLIDNSISPENAEKGSIIMISMTDPKSENFGKAKLRVLDSIDGDELVLKKYDSDGNKITSSNHPKNAFLGVKLAVFSNYVTDQLLSRKI